MRTYKITNITNTLNKRNLYYNKTLDIEFPYDMKDQKVNLKPNDNIIFKTHHIPFNIQKLKIQGLVMIDDITRTENSVIKPKKKKKTKENSSTKTNKPKKQEKQTTTSTPKGRKSTPKKKPTTKKTTKKTTQPNQTNVVPENYSTEENIENQINKEVDDVDFPEN